MEAMLCMKCDLQKAICIAIQFIYYRRTACHVLYDLIRILPLTSFYGQRSTDSVTGLYSFVFSALPY